MSRILVVGHAVKEIRNDPQHRLKKTNFIASLPAKEAQTLGLQDALPLLLVSETGLPC